MKKIMSLSLAFLLLFVFCFPVSAITYDGNTAVYINPDKDQRYYHLYTCYRLYSVPDATVLTLEAAVSRGYKPCPFCDPPAIETDVNSDTKAPADTLQIFHPFVFTETELVITLVCSAAVLILIILTVILLVRRKRRARSVRPLNQEEAAFVLEKLESGMSFSSFRWSFNKKFYTRFSTPALISAYKKAKGVSSPAAVSPPKSSVQSASAPPAGLKVSVRKKAENPRPVISAPEAPAFEMPPVQPTHTPETPHQIKCPNCGKDIPSDSVFCPFCCCRFPEIYKIIAENAKETARLKLLKVLTWIGAIIVPVLLSNAVPGIENTLAPLSPHPPYTDSQILGHGALVGILTFAIYAGAFAIARHITRGINENITVLAPPLEFSPPIKFSHPGDTEAPSAPSPAVSNASVTAPHITAPANDIVPELIDANRWKCPLCGATMSPRDSCCRCGAVFKKPTQE